MIHHIQEDHCSCGCNAYDQCEPGCEKRNCPGHTERYKPNEKSTTCNCQGECVILANSTGLVVSG